MKHAAKRIWGDREARAVKAGRALRFVGVHQVDVVTACLVPDEVVDRILGFEPEDAVSYLSPARSTEEAVCAT